MTDQQPELSTEDLLRMIGKELQAIRRACVKTANWVQVLGVITIVGVVLAFLAIGGTDSG